MPAATRPAPAAETVSPPAGTGGPGGEDTQDSGPRTEDFRPHGRSGPQTTEGRAAVSLNALSHGLRSERPVLPGESQEDWDAFLAATVESLGPRDPHQLAVARRAALAFWRLERVTRYETAQALAAWERAPQDAAAAVDLSGLGYSSRDDLVATIAASRASAATLSRVASLGDAERLPKEDALAVLGAAAALCGRLPGHALARPLGSVLDQLVLDAGYSRGPDPALPCSHAEKWTVRDLRAVLASFAAHQAFAHSHNTKPLPLRDPARPGWDRGAADSLLARAAAAAAGTADAQQAVLDRFDSETARLREERALFPPEDVLARVQRYEAHLSRQYHAAVRELRALQSLRPATAASPKTAEQSPPAMTQLPSPPGGGAGGGVQAPAEQSPRPRPTPRITERTPPPPADPASATPPESAEQSPPGPVASGERPSPRGRGATWPGRTAATGSEGVWPGRDGGGEVPLTPGRAANEAYWRREAELVARASRNRRVAIRDEDLCDASQAFSHELALDDPDSIIILDGEELPRE